MVWYGMACVHMGYVCICVVFVCKCHSVRVLHPFKVGSLVCLDTKLENVAPRAVFPREAELFADWLQEFLENRPATPMCTEELLTWPPEVQASQKLPFAS